MKSILTALCLLGLLSAPGLAQNEAADNQDQPAKPSQTDEPAIKTDKQKVSYGLGLNIGRELSRGFQRDGLEINVELLMKGLADGFSGAEPKLTADVIRKAMLAYQEELRTKQNAERKAEAEKNKKEGTAFLAKNKENEGVVTTKSGLQYVVLKAGKGEMPKQTDTVKTHYRGTLLDGTEFDSSYKRNQPATFPVSGVIKGWTEALQLMKVGAKWKLFVPAELAYGDNPRAGSPIGPGAVLVFEVELLEIVE